MRPFSGVRCGVLLAVAGCGGGGQAHTEPPPGDFAGTWRTLVTDRPELALPLIDTSSPPTWATSVFQECVYSQSGAPISQLALEWNDAQTPDRFDLSVTGLEDGRYTTAYPVAAGVQFLLPADSPYFSNEPAVLSAGPGIFPRVVELSSVPVSAGGDPHAAFAFLRHHRLVLSGISEGISITLRASTLTEHVWNATERTTVLGQICLTGDPITR
jgi:hypothetical protein